MFSDSVSRTLAQFNHRLTEIWCDAMNNVWIARLGDSDMYLVYHRHTGGVFPRLFPLAWAPDAAIAIGKPHAAKIAASIVRAYLRYRKEAYG